MFESENETNENVGQKSDDEVQSDSNENERQPASNKAKRHGGDKYLTLWSLKFTWLKVVDHSKNWFHAPYAK